jgi:thymidine phosphorylase
METMAPVELDTAAIRRVVEREGGCVMWGGAVKLSPADDILIRVERARWVSRKGCSQPLSRTPERLRGTAFGIFDMAVGVTTFAASAGAGMLWMIAGPAATFIAGAVLAAAGIAVVMFRPAEGSPAPG